MSITHPANTAYSLQELGPNSFIFRVRNALPQRFCEGFIQRFEACPGHHYAGRAGHAAQRNTALKNTTDLAISAHRDWQDADAILHKSLAMAISALRRRFPYFHGAFKDIGYNMQRYRPGEYYHWHIDSDSAPLANRQLVALWYLNTVTAGGETEFVHQSVKVTPEAGTLIVFPPFWTHRHRACTVRAGVKYIATTWLVFT